MNYFVYHRELQYSVRHLGYFQCDLELMKGYMSIPQANVFVLDKILSHASLKFSAGCDQSHNALVAEVRYLVPMIGLFASLFLEICIFHS